jgi:hypothetical protein
MSIIEWQGRRRNSLSHNLQDTYSLEQMLKWQGDVKKNQEKLFEYKVKARLFLQHTIKTIQSIKDEGRKTRPTKPGLTCFLPTVVIQWSHMV